MYDMNNLTRLKRRFNSIVCDKWGRDSTPDPLKPSRVSCVYMYFFAKAERLLFYFVLF